MFCFYIASFSKTFTTHHSIHQTWPFSPPSFLLPLSKPLFPTWTVLVDFHCPVYPMYREQLSVLYTISIGILLKQSFNFVPPMSSQFTQRNGNLYDDLTGLHNIVVSSDFLLSMLLTILSSFLFCKNIIHAHYSGYAPALPSEVLFNLLFYNTFCSFPSFKHLHKRHLFRETWIDHWA